MSEALISMTNAGVHVKGPGGGRWLVRGIDLTIKPGEIVTLIGPNGSGKSTTAKLALGIHSPDEGRVFRAPGIKVGYVMQRLHVDWTLPLTVDRFMRLTTSLTDREVEDALQLTGISGLRRAEVARLSGGEFQRALLARAIARRPDLLVLDEPTQGVDFNGEISLYELIASLKKRLECGILLVSHDLHMVMASTDTVVCLNGHICCQGEPRAVAESPEYLELFGRRAAGALAFYEHRHDHTHLPDGRVQHADGTITDHCHPDDGHHHLHDEGPVGHPDNGGHPENIGHPDNVVPIQTRRSARDG